MLKYLCSPLYRYQGADRTYTRINGVYMVLYRTCINGVYMILYRTCINGVYMV